MSTLPLRWPCLLALGWSLCLTLAGRAAPREELLQLVPEKISLCLVVNNLRAHHKNLVSTPWYQKLSNSPFKHFLLDAKELKPLQKLERELQAHLHISSQQLRDEILGDCVVFAFDHGGHGDSKHERGLALVWTKNSDLLAKLIARINRTQMHVGQLKNAPEKKTYRGVHYYQREERRDQQFYMLDGPLFVFTSDESMLHSVIDRKFRSRQKKPLTSPILRSFERLPAEESVVTFWLNPRAFDREWRPSRAAKHSALIKRAFFQYWRALDALAVSLVVGQDLELRVSVQGRKEQLPLAAQQFLQSAAAPSDLWKRFPRPSIVSAAVRVDPVSVLRMLEEFMPEEARATLHEILQKKLGAALRKDVVKEVLPNLGPDVGFYIAASAKGEVIPDVALALRVQPGPQAAPVDKALLRALEFFARAAIYDFNSKQSAFKDYLELQNLKHDSVEVHCLSSRHFPQGFQPAFALKGGYLLLTSSPGAIQRFGAKEHNVSGSPLAFVSLTDGAKWLKAQREWVAVKVAGSQPVPTEKVKKVIDDLLRLLSFVDRLHIRQDVAKGQVTWIARLEMVGPPE